MTGHTGSYRWMAPEVVRNEKYDEKVDVYSFGVILWEMMSTDVPFSNLTDMQAAMNTSNGMRPVVPNSIPEPVKQLIKDCWLQEPHLRPSFTEILARLKNIQDMGKEIGPAPGAQPACCSIV